MFRKYFIRLVVLASLTGLSHRVAAQAKDDWQVHLADGSYVYELRVKTLRATDILFEHDGKPVRIPLERIDEVRRIHKSFKRGTGGARATFGGLAGADDDVVQLSQYSVPEKHNIVARVLTLFASDSANVSSPASHHGQ